MAKIRENNTNYVKICKPKCNSNSRVAKMKTDNVFSEATTELKADINDIPSNIRLTKKDDIISVTRQAFNICRNLIFYWENMGLQNINTIPFSELNNQFHIHSNIDSKFIFSSNIKSMYVKTLNLLNYKENEILTSFNYKIEETGDYLLYLQVLTVDYNYNETATITINDKSYTISSEYIEFINNKQYITELYVSLHLEANQELVMKTNNSEVTSVCLTREHSHNAEVYKITNETYVSDKRLTDYEKINEEDLTDYLGFLPESYAIEL